MTQIVPHEAFVPAAAKRGFSLRTRIAQALNTNDEALIRRHLSVAHNILSTVPGVRVERYNPLRPMPAGISG